MKAPILVKLNSFLGKRLTFMPPPEKPKKHSFFTPPPLPVCSKKSNLIRRGDLKKIYTYNYFLLSAHRKFGKIRCKN